MRVFVRSLIFVYFPESPLTPPKPPHDVSGDLSDPDATLNDTVFSAVYPDVTRFGHGGKRGQQDRCVVRLLSVRLSSVRLLTI